MPVVLCAIDNVVSCNRLMARAKLHLAILQHDTDINNPSKAAYNWSKRAVQLHIHGRFEIKSISRVSTAYQAVGLAPKRECLSVNVVGLAVVYVMRVKVGGERLGGA